MTNNETIKKYAGAVAKGLISQVPVIGSITVELLNVTIPNQRVERIEKLLKILLFKISDTTPEDIENKFKSVEITDIFEDVLLQSTRATSQARLGYLASVLEKSLSNEKIQHLTIKRLLSILAELNDIEIIILQSYNYSDYKNDEFKEKHKEIFKDDQLVQDISVSKSEREKYSMFLSYKNHLISLGLIGPEDIRKKTYQTYLTPFGGMLLKLIGVEEAIEESRGTAINPLTAIQSIQGIVQDLQPDILAGTTL